MSYKWDLTWCLNFKPNFKLNNAVTLAPNRRLKTTLDWPWCGNRETPRDHHLYVAGPLHFKGKQRKMEASKVQYDLIKPTIQHKKVLIFIGGWEEFWFSWPHNSAQIPKTYQMIIYKIEISGNVKFQTFGVGPFPFETRIYSNGRGQNDKLMIKIIKKEQPFSNQLSLHFQKCNQQCTEWSRKTY